MNKENDRDHVTEISMVEGSVEKFTYEEMAIATKAMKLRKAAGLSKICAEMISASEEVDVSVMIELCQRASNGKEM